MTIIYSKEGRLFDWDRSQLITDDEVKIGDPLTIEFKRIFISSKKFDKFGPSEILIVNHVKNKQTKDRTLESIVYYDDDAKTKGSVLGKKTWGITRFDASEYGNPVCFHTPGYLGSIITITTKFWEVDKYSSISSIIGGIGSALHLVSKTNPYLEIASTAANYTSIILNGAVHHSELDDEHTIEFRLDSSCPLLPGKYICIPNADINEKNRVISDYFIDDNLLLKAVGEKDNFIFEEYKKSYFILKVTNHERTDLADFDFIASSADILREVNGDKEKVLQANRDSYDLNILKEIKKLEQEYNETGDDSITPYITALTKQLDKSNHTLI